MKKRVMLILSCLLLSIGFIVAQTTKVAGTVVDSNGEPVISASVVVKGTTIGTVTDIDGSFSINVPQGNNTLVFSLVGMETVEAAPVSGMRVVMSPNENVLEAQVIIGYGTARKVGTITGSVATVASKAVEMKPVGNAVDMLEGKVSGLQIHTESGEPTASANVVIRGSGSLTAGTTPLYILDGVPVASNIMLMLNNNDIASVTVLKDASATSIYGARAANGVIYITTKKGTRGAKGKVTLSASYGVSSLARRVGTPMNTAEIAGLQLETGYLDKEKYEQIMASGIDTNWQDWFFSDSAPTTQVDLSISGGNENTTYYVSGAYFKQEGVAMRSLYEKFNARANVESKVNDWLRVGVNIGGLYDKRQVNGFTYTGSASVYGGNMVSTGWLPYYTPYGENGEDLDLIEGLGYYSTYYLMKVQPGETNVANILATGFIQLTPIEGLTIRSQGSIDAYDQRGSSKRLKDKYNLFTPRTQESFARNSYLSINNTAEYKFNLDRIHNFTVLLGQEGIKNNNHNIGLITTKQPNNYLMNLSHGEEVLISDVTHGQYDYVYSSFFGRIGYDYEEKYFADFSVRNDASSRFGKNNRNATFFSGGLLWDAKKENFLKEVGFLSDFRVKASVGSQGNSSIGNYDHMATIGNVKYNTGTGWQLTGTGNPDLKWEQNIQTSFTINAGFIDNRYTAELALYNRKTKDMLMNAPIPGTTGFTTYLMNVGSMTNRGIELSLNAELVRSKDFTFTVGGLFTYNKEKIDELFYGFDEWPMLSSLTNYKVGEGRKLYMAKFAGIDPANGQQMWYIPGTDQVTSEFDEELLAQDTGKNYRAPIYGGFNFYFRWKDLSLNADFSYSLDKWMVNNDNFFDHNPKRLSTGYNQSRDLLSEMWLKEGDVGKKWPSYGTEIQFDDRLLENASYLRLKDLTLSYNLPKTLLEKTKFFESVRIFGTSRNLFTITKYSGSDPTIQSNLVYGSYPSSRQFVFGAQVSF